MALLHALGCVCNFVLGIKIFIGLAPGVIIQLQGALRGLQLIELTQSKDNSLVLQL